MKHLLLFTLFLFISCNSRVTNQQKVFCMGNQEFDSAKILTVSELLNNTTLYNNKIVIVKGFFIYEFENVGLYENSGDYKQSKKKSAISINSTIEFVEKVGENQLLDLDESAVIVHGLFNTEHQGHFSQFAGTLEIDCLKSLE